MQAVDAAGGLASPADSHEDGLVGELDVGNRGADWAVDGSLTAHGPNIVELDSSIGQANHEEQAVWVELNHADWSLFGSFDENLFCLPVMQTPGAILRANSDKVFSSERNRVDWLAVAV